MKKSLKDISWQVPEEEYRADQALSYSTLAKYEREGFEHLDTLFDKTDSPSLLFGSCVDTILTDGEEAFNKRFLISDIPVMKPSVEPVVREIFERFHNSYTNINDILDSDIMHVISEYKYQPNWKNETRCKSIKQEGAQYYQTMFMANGKEIVSQEVYNKVFNCVRALKDSPQTQGYFCADDPFSDVERCYQLKFKGTLNNYDYRCMADLIMVNHKKKLIVPCDLKTSNHREYDFPKSFLQWRYDIQARLYWRLIRQAMDSDEYFKEFKLMNYRFIVVNNVDNPTPLIWEFSNTQTEGILDIAGHKLRDPETIGKELYYYLENRPQVPINVSLQEMNNIEGWLETEN